MRKKISVGDTYYNIEVERMDGIKINKNQKTELNEYFNGLNESENLSLEVKAMSFELEGKDAQIAELHKRLAEVDESYKIAFEEYVEDSLDCLELTSRLKSRGYVILFLVTVIVTLSLIFAHNG